MYSNKIAACLKVGGKVLREEGDTVYLPFGSEYTISIKNLNSVRALVSIEIDGQDIADGTQFVIGANSSIDIERFVKNGNFSAGQRFKFIERTRKIEDGPRGIRVEDGLIRLQVEFEKPVPAIDWSKTRFIGQDALARGYPRELWNATLPPSPEMFNSTSIVDAIGGSIGDVGMTAQAASVPVSDIGITVGGSVSEQKFEYASNFPTDGIKHVLVLRLLGAIGEKPIQAPVTVKTVLTCPTCGTKNKVGSKFCAECGTGLTLV